MIRKVTNFYFLDKLKVKVIYNLSYANHLMYKLLSLTKHNKIQHHQKILFILLLSFSLLLLPVFPRALASDSNNIDNLTPKFWCVCGCSMLLSVCESQMECDTAGSMKQTILGLADEGYSESQIVDTMKSYYGESVLAEPSMSGFGITLWIYPVLAGIIGLSAVIVIGTKKKDNVEWRVDPDESLDFQEEDLDDRIEKDDASQTDYDQLLQEKLEELEKKK
jgi:cytochrome c-type biogenesis protein CcmH/NrfF